MSWGCGLCQLLAGGVLLALLAQLVRWLRADGDLTLLWAEWRGKKPGKNDPKGEAARPERPPPLREAAGRRGVAPLEALREGARGWRRVGARGDRGSRAGGTSARPIRPQLPPGLAEE